MQLCVVFTVCGFFSLNEINSKAKEQIENVSSIRNCSSSQLLILKMRDKWKIIYLFFFTQLEIYFMGCDFEVYLVKIFIVWLR